MAGELSEAQRRALAGIARLGIAASINRRTGESLCRLGLAECWEYEIVRCWYRGERGRIKQWERDEWYPVINRDYQLTPAGRAALQEGGT